jgi:methylated-DNA-[protein]-cysteine S-methyltransferase
MQTLAGFGCPYAQPVESLRCNEENQFMETLYYSRLESPVGTLYVGVSEQGMVLLDLHGGEFLRKKQAGRTKNKIQWVESEEKTAAYVRELKEYFAGRRKEFSFPLDLRGTKFQKLCWQALLKIPYGKTRSYAEIAREVGSPRSFRAVGQANHQNPVAIVVPCHRVITSDGKLGGYGGGLAMKEKLLQMEGAMQQLAPNLFSTARPDET